MLVVTLAAIAVEKADQKKPTQVATGIQAGASSDGGAGSGDEGQGGNPGAAAQGTNGGGGGGGSGPAAAAPGAKGATAGNKAPGGAAAGRCTDYNPDQGVYCDR